MRIIADSSFLDDDVRAQEFYFEQYDKTDKYLFTYYSTLMLMQGGDTTPIGDS
jgi:hypothetical protein